MKFGDNAAAATAQAAADIEHHHHVAAAPAVREPARRQREDAEGEERRGAERKQFAVGPAVNHLEADHHGREDQHHIVVDRVGEVVEADGQPPAGFVVQGLRDGKRHCGCLGNLPGCRQSIYRAAPYGSYADFEALTAGVGRRSRANPMAPMRFGQCGMIRHSTGHHNRRAHNLLRERRYPLGLGSRGRGAPMRNGGRIITLCSSRRGVCATACGALAETVQTGDDQDTHILAALARPAPDSPMRAQSSTSAPGQARFLLFSNTDLWRHGGFAHGGVLWAPTGLDQEGPVLKLMFGGGIYHYRLRRARQRRRARRTACRRDAARLAFHPRRIRLPPCFSAIDFQQHRLTPDDPSAGLRGDYAWRAHGLRALVSANARRR